MRERCAEIAGAGLAGLALAVRLAQLGWRVVLHERNAELRMFGAGIWLWENGLRSLKVLGAYDAALARAKTIKEWRICDGKGRVLMSRPMTPDDRLLLPPRADLYQALIDRAYALGVDIETSSHVASATPDGVLILQSGEERKADLVVGADGAFSRIREAILCTRWMDFGIEAGIRMMIDYRPGDPEEIATEYWNGPWRLLYNPCTSGENYIFLSAPVLDESGPQAPGGSRSLEIPVSACARPDLPLLGSQPMGPHCQCSLPQMVGGPRCRRWRCGTRHAAEPGPSRKHGIQQRARARGGRYRSR